MLPLTVFGFTVVANTVFAAMPTTILAIDWTITSTLGFAWFLGFDFYEFLIGWAWVLSFHIFHEFFKIGVVLLGLPS